MEKNIYCANLSQWMHIRGRWQNLYFSLEKDDKEIAYLKIWAPGRHAGQVTCSLYLSILYSGCYCSMNTQSPVALAAKAQAGPQALEPDEGDSRSCGEERRPGCTRGLFVLIVLWRWTPSCRFFTCDAPVIAMSPWLWQWAGGWAAGWENPLLGLSRTEVISRRLRTYR